MVKVSSKKFLFNFSLEENVCNDIEITIYRVVIELINNTMKYAGADSIGLNVWQDDGNITIEYTDDGVGFNFTETIEKKVGMGLFNIQHRINSFNGEVKFYRIKPKGIKYIIRIPCKA